MNINSMKLAEMEKNIKSYLHENNYAKGSEKRFCLVFPTSEKSFVLQNR